MIPGIKELMHSTPFSPWPDHAAVNPKGTYVVLFSDNDTHANVTGLHVAAVDEQTSDRE
jgi:hypothetical protein